MIDDRRADRRTTHIQSTLFGCVEPTSVREQPWLNYCRRQVIHPIAYSLDKRNYPADDAEVLQRFFGFVGGRVDRTVAPAAVPSCSIVDARWHVVGYDSAGQETVELDEVGIFFGVNMSVQFGFSRFGQALFAGLCLAVQAAQTSTEIL